MQSNSPEPPDDARTGSLRMRGEETRSRLLRAASGLFARAGYDGTAISDVAREAGVGVGTVYHHFADKRALLIDLIEQFEEYARRTSHPTGRGSLIGTAWEEPDVRLGLVKAIEAIADRRPHPGIFSIALEVARRDDDVAARCWQLRAMFRGMLRVDIERGQQRGRVRPELDPEIASVLLWDALDTGIRRLDDVKDEYERDSLIAAVADLTYRYLAVD